MSAGTTWTPPPPPPAVGGSLKDRMAALNAASGGAAVAPGAAAAPAPAPKTNGKAKSSGLAASLDDQDDDEDLEGDFADLTGGLSAAKLGTGKARAAGGSKDDKSAAAEDDGTLSERDVVSDESDSEIAQLKAKVLKQGLPQLSDGEDNDIDLHEAHRFLIPGSAPPPAGSAPQFDGEMGEGERAIFGGDDYEPELAEFAEPEGGRVDSKSQWENGSQLSPTSAAAKKGAMASGRSSVLTKCADPRCMSFAARGAYCLRHVWQEAKKQPAPGKEAEQAAKLTAAFDELLAVEDKYNKSLWSGLHYFHDRLRALIKLDKPLLSAADVERIFQNLHELHRVSEDLLSDLKDLKSRHRLATHTGAVFLHYTPLFEVYRKYCAGHAAAMQALAQAKDKSPAFRAFVEWNEKCEGSSLDALLSVPNVALMRYMQLLEEMKGALAADSVMRPDIEGAYRRIADLSAAIDAATGVTPQHKQVQLIADGFEHDAKYIDIVTPFRTFVRSGQMKKKYNKTARHAAGTKIYTFFLFSDLLVLAALTKAKRYKMKQFVPLYEVSVKPQPGPKREENEFEIKPAKKKAFTIIAATQKERDEWVAAIEARVQETRRNPPPNSPIGLRGADGGDEADSFSLGKSAASNRASVDDDFSAPGPSKNFKPIGGIGAGSAVDSKSGSVSEPISPKQSVAGGAAAAAGVITPSSNISEAAARLGIVEEADTDPEANVMFGSDSFEPPAPKPQSLYVVI